jgi:serine/threonine-protein kinase
MSEAHPWERNWKVEDANFGGGGQGKAQLVSLKTKPDTARVLKILKRQNNAKDRQRMNREVTSLRTLANQGVKVPRVLEANTHEAENLRAELYFVMERIPGLTLDKEIKARGPLPLEQAVAVTLDLCTTVAAAHRERVLHRDLKPENIVVRDFEKADLVIVDYGLSFNEEEDEDVSITDTNDTLGNRFFRSLDFTLPGADKRNPLADMASLSAIFYYCLTGHRPVQPLDGHGKLPHRREGCSVRGPLKDHPRAADVEALLDRGFAPDFGSQFRTPEEVAERLRSLLLPSGPRGGRNFAQVARDSAVQLRQGNRSVRLAEAGQRISEIRNHLNGLVGSMMRGLDPIYTWSQNGNSPMAMPTGIDKLGPTGVADVNISLAIKGTDLTRWVVFRFGADQEQGVILRVVAKVAGGTLDTSRPWEKVKWFNLQEPPRGEDILPLVEDGLALAIQELVEEARGQ